MRQGGTQGKKIANPINENENHTIWLLKEVHHEKPNQSLSEIIVIQGIMYNNSSRFNEKGPPPPSLQPAYVSVCVCGFKKEKAWTTVPVNCG